jgi:prepilin-type N-terminal cleavage/methylation domain-containing protein
MTVRARLSDDSGFTLIEMLVVLAILGIVLTALTTLFVSAMRAQADQTKRFQSQQQARLALDGLRREIHCASTIAPATSAAYPTTSITITLGSYCPSAPAAGGSVTWCTIGTSARYALWRTPGTTCTATGGVKKADYLTASGWTGQVFTALTPAGSGSRAKLGVRLPVNVPGSTTGGRYELQDDIVLRNTSR